MFRTDRQSFAVQLALVGALSLSSLVGCAGTTPVSPANQAPNQSGAKAGQAKAPSATTPSQATPASAAGTTAEQSAAAWSQEQELEAYGALANDLDANPAAYRLQQLGQVGAALSGQANAAASATGQAAQATGSAAANATANANGQGASVAADASAQLGATASGARPLAQDLKARIEAQAQAKGELAVQAAREAAEKARAQLKNAQEAIAEARAQVVVARQGVKSLQADLRAKAKAQVTASVQALRPRLERMTEARAQLVAAANLAAYVDHGDGTKTKTFDFTETKVVGQLTLERQVHVVRTVSSEDMTLIASETSFSQSWPNGASLVSSRSQVLQADGSYLIAFHEEAKLSGGAMRQADWTKTIAADGSVSGSGTVVVKRANGEAVRTWSLSFSGTQGATSMAVKEPESGAEANLSLDAQGHLMAKAKEAGEAEANVALAIDAEGRVQSSAEDLEAAAEVGVAVQAALH